MTTPHEAPLKRSNWSISPAERIQVEVGIGSLIVFQFLRLKLKDVDKSNTV